jgi:formylglycine-generating enzyme required for sulfatase activity
VRTAAGLRHPHIVTIHDVGEEAGQHYLAMAFLPGRTLDKWLSEGPLPVEQAVSIVEQIAGALDAIHEQQLVHRDVKPGNIMLDEAGQATLLDFGIVRAAEGTRLTTTMAVLGTPEYMAPEQAELDEAAEIDWRADVYALGVVAYQMLVGQPPFAGKSPTAVLYKHVHEPPPAPGTLNPDLPAGLEPVLLKALAKRREERFQQAGAFAAALRRALLPVLPAREELRRPQRRPMPAWWAAAGGAILVLLVGLGIALGPRLFGAGSVPVEAPPDRPTDVPAAVPVEAVAERPTEMPAAAPTEAPTEKVPGEPAVQAGTTWTRPADGMVMVHVPGGTFQMGSDESDPDAEVDEFPRHAVTLDAFWIDQTEVTNTQYRQCVEAGVCQAPPEACDYGSYGHAHRADHPVLCVDWYGAVAYCEWAEARLPTEAEWEYAARGPDNFIYPWGNSPPDNTLLNYAGNVDDTTKVGSYPGGASWCQALDMAGNVWEWVADWHGKHPSEAQTNPTGQPVGEYKMVHGGSYVDGPTCVRAAHRFQGLPDDRSPSRGFRCAGQAGD